MKTARIAWWMTLAALAALSGCGNDEPDAAAGESAATRFVLASVVIDADDKRTTYVQTIRSLDDGPFNNDAAIEIPGNGVVMAGDKDFYLGLAEEPTWVRYSFDDKGGLEESGRLSFLDYGEGGIDFGNVFVDEQTAVSIVGSAAVAVVWNPSTMTIRGEIDLSHLVRKGYALETWTTIAHDGLVYVPGRWADWEGARIFDGVSLTILDPKAMVEVGTAEDDRCASGGRPIFDEDGYAYVMGDGRNYSIQMFANASGDSAPENCLLRIAPGQAEFEQSYFYTLPSLTGGLESITELETARQGSGVAFAKMFYPDELPKGVEPVDFAFWDVPAHKMWRIELADPPSAKEVDGIPFSAIGFEGSVLNGRLYTGESLDGAESEVYETDPDTNRARLRFTMDGYFNGLFALAK